MIRLIKIKRKKIMPITQSAKKALRQNQKRKKRNVSQKVEAKKIQKKIKKLVTEKKIEEAKKLLPQFYKTIDKTVKNKIVKKNTAARKKSRLTKTVNACSTKTVK